MSIPERLWRVAKGHLALAEERIRDLEAEATAYQELADAIRVPPPPPASEPAPATAASRPAAPAERPAASRGGHDPLEASYLLLRLEPGTGMVAVQAAYEARMGEIRPEQAPPGSPQRASLEAQRTAVQAAYDRIRDALNPTETRFERLEL